MARARRKPFQLALIAVIAATVGLMKLPLIPVVLVLTPISILVAWRRGAADGQR